MNDITVLIVDGESRMRKLIKDFLMQKNYKILDAEDGAYDHSYREDCTVFTLQDIIELLQGTKSFYFRKACENFYLKIEKFSDTNYSISYENSDHFCVGFSGVCLLTCAYNMLVWVAENGYLKTK